MNTTFSILLLQLLREQNINLTKLHKDLVNLGVDITYSSLYAYYTGVVVPPFGVAKKILKVENVDISDSELEKTLSYSKRVQKSETADNGKILNLNLKIKSGAVNEEYKQNSKLLKSILEMRANELFGDDDLVTQFSVGKRKLSAYVAYLVKQDLIKNGYIKNQK